MKASLSIPRISCATNMLLGCDPNIAGNQTTIRGISDFGP